MAKTSKRQSQPERKKIETQYGLVHLTKTGETRQVAIGGKTGKRTVWRDHQGHDWVQAGGHWWRVRYSRFLDRTFYDRDERF